MLWLFLSIFSVVGIFIMFKIIDKVKADLIYALVINYLIAAIIGFAFTNNFNIIELSQRPWFPISIFIGILFIGRFFLLGITTKKVGLSISTVASKMSVVITIVFALIYFNENVSVIKIISICTAIFAVLLALYKKNEKQEKTKIIYLLLPFILFLSMGLVDSLIAFSQGTFPELQDNYTSAKFTSTAFSFSFITGLIYTTFKPKELKKFFKRKNIFCGIVLGMINFGSIYFVIQALNEGILQKSVIYGIVNISCVIISVLLGWLLFKEKLKAINFIGIIIAIISLLLLILSDGGYL